MTDQQTQTKPRGRVRRILKWGFRITAVLVLVLALIFVVVFHNALYNRFIRFPRETAALEEIRAARVAPELDDGWNEYRGVCHSHSEFSHDCEVPFEDILAVLKASERDFICMSDHCHEGKADYGVQWKGLKDGVLFVRGYEMKYGFMPWGLPDDVVLNCNEEPEVLARRIAAHGGLLFFAHTEEEREWYLPELVGMEIYNIHTDFKDEDIMDLAPDLLMNFGAYPDLTFRLIFDRQTDIIERWDKLNWTRDIVGIAANDCHQNNGIRMYWTEDEKLYIENTSGEEGDTHEVGAMLKLLLRVAFGPLEPGRMLFHFQPDPYGVMVRYVATHVLARELAEPALLDSLEEGRVFVAFDMLADARGFVFLAEDGGKRAVMGEALPFTDSVQLRAAAPNDCRFIVKRAGETVHTAEGRAFDWRPEEPGKYRVEAELNILGEWVPWIYANPLELTAPEEDSAQEAAA